MCLFDTLTTGNKKKIVTLTEYKQTFCPHLQRSRFCGTRAAAMMPGHKWCHDVMRHEMCERLSCEICKAHLPRPCSSSVPPPAPPASSSAAQWGLMMHGLRHANSMACNCLVTVMRDSQGAPPPALLFLRCSHSRMMSCASVHKRLVL